MEEPSIQFSEKSIRRAFIIKVYSILMMELAVALCIIFIFTFSGTVKQALHENHEIATVLMFFGFLGFLVVFYTFACVPSARKNVPLNFILMTIAAVCAGLMLGVTSSVYETSFVLMAMTATFTIVASITAIASVTSYDITSKGNVLFVVGAVFSIAMLVASIMSFFMKVKLLYTILVGIGVLIVSAFLLYDTQLIIGGRNHEISPEEYIYASIMLFSDIMNLYMYILYLFGDSS